ncbi:MAG: diaminopimelate dehydrogenase [Clostridia bacterium]|nr:diaminopimelate dehydrogenase [Clostridia bacterium]
MMINIGIFGYGNLGKGVEAAIRQNEDMCLNAVFTRRDPESVNVRTQGLPVYHADKLLTMKDEIDVLILCGGSATDLPEQTPFYAQHFNVVDSFDNHANIPVHFENVNKAALAGGKTALISAGWDPGMFSVNRLYASCIQPEGKNYTFWGRGVSQGHSDAIRRIEGVVDARQYTVPVEDTVETVRRGEQPTLTARQMHKRECFVVAAEGADKVAIETAIKTMPNYFEPYDTTVHFITAEEMKAQHGELPHGGFVIRSGVTGLNKEHKNIIEYKLTLDSNPEFTSSVLVAGARTVYRLNKEGQTGCKTMFDIAPAYYSPLSGDELRHTML